MIEASLKLMELGYYEVQYAVFHIAYHTGQMYSARHFLGEETPDN